MFKSIFDFFLNADDNIFAIYVILTSKQAILTPKQLEFMKKLSKKTLCVFSQAQCYSRRPVLTVSCFQQGFHSKKGNVRMTKNVFMTVFKDTINP